MADMPCTVRRRLTDAVGRPVSQPAVSKCSSSRGLGGARRQSVVKSWSSADWQRGANDGEVPDLVDGMAEPMAKGGGG